MSRKSWLAGLVAGLGLLSVNPAHAAVEIEYWQYIFDTRVKAIDQLIEKFQQANPDIKVKQVTFPYADYQTRVIAANLAGNSPDVVQFFYGWLDKFVAGGLVQPLPKDTFAADKIESEFFPIVTALKRDGEYYGVPTAVRSLGLFYNKNLLKEAGLDPSKPPQTLDALIEAAGKVVKRDASGNLVTAGLTIEVTGQDHHWWREGLVRQFGGVPYSEDGSKVAYDSEAGQKAFAFYTSLQTEHKLGEQGFIGEGPASFLAGRSAFTIDGTFRLGGLKAVKDFEWGVTELPATADGKRFNYASYFANGIGSKTSGEKLEAAKKFLAYISSPEAQELWLQVVGELPARKAVALTEKNLADPTYGPFLKGLESAYTTRFVDEAAQRQVIVDATNRVLLQGQSPKDSLAEAAKAEQEILDSAK